MPLPELTVHWKDLSQYLNQSTAPQFYLERPLKHGTDVKGGVFNKAEVARTGEFWVPQQPILGDDCQWAFCRAGEAVRVPIYAYRTTNRSEAAILATGLQIGLAAVMSLLQANGGHLPIATHLMLGHQCLDLVPSGVQAYRCHVGICFQTKP